MILLFISLYFFNSCKKDDFAWNLKKLPEVGYITIVSNDPNEFELTTDCISTGNSKEIEMGFCWSLLPNPSIEDNVIPNDNKNQGSFSVNIPWTSVSSYHFRAYVKNEVGIVYSQNCIVNWPGSPSLPQVQTLNTDQVSFYSFNVNCNVLSTGGNPLIQKGVYLYDNPNGSNPIATVLSWVNTSDYSVSLNALSDGVTYYVRAFAVTLAGTSYGSMLTVTLPKKYSIGETGPAGGVIIYEHPDPLNSWHYLEVPPIDISGTFVWSPSTGTTNITSTELGQGFPNSIAINNIYGNSNSYAALGALNWSYAGFTDWVLPSFNELKLMKEVLFDQGLGNFSNGMYYWSSSEDPNYSVNAWTVKMFGTSQNNYITQGKNQYYKVRAIRKF
jgi:hypothetical protein